jgi:thiol-disulfide isomerase/thioredoxin
MVDWDRVEQLRSKGWDWERIAADPKVGFHPERAVHDPGRALRGLYHRQKSREGRTGKEATPTRPSKKDEEITERKWNLPRTGYLLTPLFGFWLLLAYVAPSPVGILLPAFPWLGIGLAVAAFILLFGLLRSSGRRWTPTFRTTLIGGVVLGLLVAGSAGVVGYLAFGCPYLPPASTLTAEPGGWAKASANVWQEGGKPVVYFYGATWCPYCSASSWAIWKALISFSSSVTNVPTGYSSADPAGPYTPEIILASAQVSPDVVAFQVSEDSSGVQGNFPGSNTCYQQAYVGAYSGGAIPFLVVGGVYIHSGASLVAPSNLASWADGANGGAGTVYSSVSGETSTPWTYVQSPAWWMMAYMAKASGVPVATLASTYAWTTATKNAVTTDLAQIS